MIKRNILNSLKNELSRPEIVILLGPRQVGKTTLLKMLRDFIDKSGKKTAFFDLEQPQVLADFNCSDKEIVKVLSSAGDVIFIDEFQYLKNASKIFKAIFDSQAQVKIICSGSSSLEIHKHLKESLAGRRFLYRIFPLQYDEIKGSIPEFTLEQYLKLGGMPGLFSVETEDRQQQILSELLGSYILKDVRALIKEENVRAFNHLLYLLAERQGSTVSISSLANDVGMSSKAVNRYLDILEQTYINYRVYSFSRNLGNELRKSCKTYLYDLGIRNILLKDFSLINDRADKGSILESVVFLHLQAMLKPNMEIKFWRTKAGDEVDFILLKDRKPIPIEVKSKINPLEIPVGLRRFLNRYPEVKTAYVINEQNAGNVIFEKCQVQFLTFENFLSPKFVI